MKVVLVTGDRDWTDWELLYDVLDRAAPDILIEGEARGADKWSRNWAESRGFLPLEADPDFPPTIEGLEKRFIPVPADWKRFKRAAGPIRNGWMAKLLQYYSKAGYECEIYAFHNDIENSKGTKDMIEKAKRLGIYVTLIESL